MTKDLIVKVEPMRKSRPLNNGTQQFKLLAKVGYESMGRFRVIERYEVKILKGGEIYRVTDQEYNDLRNKISDESLRIFGIKRKIKQLILQAIEDDEELSADLIHQRLYQIENDIETKKKVAGWNKFLSIHDLEVSKTEIEELEKEIELFKQDQGFITDEDIADIASSMQLSKAISKEQEQISKMDYITRYKKGHFSRNNIFDVFGFLWTENPTNSDPYIPKSYRSLILQLNDYRFNSLPPQSISDFNTEWIDGFFKYLIKHGYPDVRIKGYDPLNINKYYDRLKSAKRKPYKVQAFEKIVKHFKRYLALLKELEMIKYHKEVKLISASKYLSRDISNDNFTKKEFSLNPEEYHRLATTDFKNQELNLARDMFIIMVQGGGFRTNELYKYVRIHDSEITVYRPKTKETVTNPIWGYLAEVIDRHKGIPQNMLPVEDFRKSLKEIADILSFDRIIARPNTVIHNKKKEEMTIDDEIEEIIIKDVFNPEFARKTLVTYLSHVKNMKDEDIISFTSHKNIDTLKHYKSSRTIVEKTRLVE